MIYLLHPWVSLDLPKPPQWATIKLHGLPAVPMAREPIGFRRKASGGGEDVYISVSDNNCMFMFVNVYSCLMNAFCSVSIWFESKFNLIVLLVRWTQSLVRPTLDATKDSVQRPDNYFWLFSFTVMFYTSSDDLSELNTVCFTLSQ